MNIVNNGDHLFIDLGNGLRPRVKMLFGVYAIVSLLTAGFLVSNIFELIDSGIVAILFFAGLAIAYLVATKYFYIKLFGKEELVVTAQTITLITGASSGKKSRSFDIGDITELQYAGFQKTTDHPLKGQSLDYFGLETQQQIANTLHDEGNISFFYHGSIIRFGRDIYSWQAEELNTAISAFTEGRLVIANLPENIEVE